MIIYDCEILNAIPGDSDPEPDIKYCEGWSDFKGMGIACIGFYHSVIDKYLIAEKNNVFQYHYDGTDFIFETEIKLDQSPTGFDFFVDQVRTNKEKGRQLIGFNSISFDDDLLGENGYDVLTDIDLLCEVRIASQQPPYYDKRRTRGGYSLNNLAFANNLRTKTMSGAIAPIEWQRGNKEAVRQYCLHDVLITKQLFELDVIIDPTDSEPLVISRSGNYDGWYEQEKLRNQSMIICGKEYQLEQSFTSTDKKSLLQDEDGDIEIDYQLPDGMTGKEAVCELWLRSNDLFQYKPSEVSAVSFIEMLETIFDKGKIQGEKEKMQELIDSFQYQIERLDNE